ncbi:hypothetical protein AWB74_08387 [Caballeronia arvi]|uniref:Uncharacterized protein n=1 Tax=Caballeronia arvi TaxID=1777135 RepID=A0A158L406_9BURK|nr:hypothetical protein AWB74_08387 [Caballeronia arvi]
MSQSGFRTTVPIASWLIRWSAGPPRLTESLRGASSSGAASSRRVAAWCLIGIVVGARDCYRHDALPMRARRREVFRRVAALKG